MNHSTVMPSAPHLRTTHRFGNYLKTAVLMAGLTALFLVVGERLGGAQGMLLAGIMVALLNFGTYWFSDRIALAMNHAQPLERFQLPWLHEMVSSLARRANIPMPKLYIVPGPTPNAFATGRNPEHAAVAVTEGILHILDRRELQGVLAHELSHVKNRDTLISTIAATLAGVITFAARAAFWFGGSLGGGRDRDERDGSALASIGMLIIAPIAAMLLQLAISRSREYGADASGAELCRDPDSLASALEKLEHGVNLMPTEQSPATAPLYIVNPLRGGGLLTLFSTHPSTQERVRRLREMTRPSLVR